MYNMEYLEGRRFCVVFVKILDVVTGRVQCRCLRGRASWERGHLEVISEKGGRFSVPATALPSVAPSDGTPILRDAEFFCLVKVSDNIDLDGGSHHHHHADGCQCGHCHDDDDDDCGDLIIPPVVY